jgi:translation initiation factor IF-3
MVVVHNFKDALEAIAKVESGPKIEGRNINMVLSPKC